jgi:hypothetical protein
MSNDAWLIVGLGFYVYLMARALNKQIEGVERRLVSVEREGAMKLLIVCAAILMAFAILRPAQAHRMTTHDYRSTSHW